MAHVPVIVLLISIAVLGFVSSFQPSVKRLVDIFSTLDNRDLRDKKGHISTRKRHIFSCRKEKESCWGAPPCCGTLQCYWQGGYSPFRTGICVQCLAAGKECQRDSSCCGEMICNTQDSTYFNGECRLPKSSGDCYRDAQCKQKCNRDWHKQHGTCT